jgi:homoserine O-acetyltransferase
MSASPSRACSGTSPTCRASRWRTSSRPTATARANLAYQGKRFVERFDANTYLRLSMAIDLFDLGATPEALQRALAPAGCRWLVISFTSDWLFPPEQSQELTRALIADGKPVSYCNIVSRAGHDAFLLANELPTYGGLIQGFLAHCGDGDGAPKLPPAVDSLGHAPTDIFYHDRVDYDRICALIPEGASVLDLGCGAGGLLARLKARGHRRLMGVELSQDAVTTAVGRGLDVVQGDLDEGLSQFGTRAFDVVVLSQTLQAIFDVEQVLSEMLRVGRKAIVSFPNAGHARCRRRLSEQGRAPETTGLARYRWYNTPNIRLVTVADFEELCELKGWNVLSRVFLDTASRSEAHGDPNLNADVAVYALSV